MRVQTVRTMMLMLLTLVLSAAVERQACANNLIGVNFTTATATIPDPQNWNRYSQLSGALSNLIDDTGAPTGVTFAATPTVGDGFLYLSSSTLAPDATPQFDYDLSGMVGYGFRAGGAFRLEFRGLQPNTPYEYWVVGYRAGGAIDNSVMVSNGDTLGAVSFDQFILFADNDGRFLVNTSVSADTDNFNDYAFVTNSSSTGILTIDLAGVSQTTVLGALAIRMVPEPSFGLGIMLLSLVPALRRRSVRR